MGSPVGSKGLGSLWDFIVSLLMGRWSFWMRAPSSMFLCKKLHRPPWLPVPSFLTSQTLLHPLTSAQPRRQPPTLRCPLGSVSGLAPPTPFFLFFPRRCGGRWRIGRGKRAPGVISHLPRYLLGLPFLPLITQGAPVCAELRLLGVAVRYRVWLAWVLPPALWTWGELFLWHLEMGGV